MNKIIISFHSYIAKGENYLRRENYELKMGTIGMFIQDSIGELLLTLNSISYEYKSI